MDKSNMFNDVFIQSNMFNDVFINIFEIVGQVMLNESFYCENAPLRGHDHIVIDMCTFYNERKITLVIRHLG